ncbi:MAG: sigma-54-dependent Fis family transcriptional regulator [Bacteroidia bacterium]|nr:sigma-54-dependent Fis family transcriptional regulator [Bacteroidia bacterium]
MNKVFVIEDNVMYAMAMKQALADENYEIEVFHNGQDFLDQLSQKPDVVTIDYMLPDMSGMDILKKIQEFDPEIQTIFLSGQEDVNKVVEAYKNGVKSYIVKNDNALVELQQSIKNCLSTVSLKKEVALLNEEITDRNKYAKIIGQSNAMMRVLKLIQRVEKTDTLVMITGDSGTGKELIAEAIHTNSNRRRKPYVAINIAAIPANLLEDELFGHERGAFTGASGKRKGRFEEANGGTIFLDEIGEMDIQLQTKLLRVLQEKVVTRLGSNKNIKLDVRIIAATNRNLGEQVKLGNFREDLYYRIQGFLIHLPPLRDRGGDVLLLAEKFLQVYCDKHGLKHKTIGESAKEALLNHPFPGNVRELIALMERCVLMSDGDVIEASDLIFSDVI